MNGQKGKIVFSAFLEPIILHNTTVRENIIDVLKCGAKYLNVVKIEDPVLNDR